LGSFAARRAASRSGIGGAFYSRPSRHWPLSRDGHHRFRFHRRIRFGRVAECDRRLKRSQRHPRALRYGWHGVIGVRFLRAGAYLVPLFCAKSPWPRDAGNRFGAGGVAQHRDRAVAGTHRRVRVGGGGGRPGWWIAGGANRVHRAQLVSVLAVDLVSPRRGCRPRWLAQRLSCCCRKCSLVSRNTGFWFSELGCWSCSGLPPVGSRVPSPAL